MKFLLLAVLVLLFSLLCGCNAGNAVKSAAPVARQGVLDLTTWNFENDGSVDLNGEWEFYWHQLLFPQVFAGPGRRPMTGFFIIPAL